MIFLNEYNKWNFHEIDHHNYAFKTLKHLFIKPPGVLNTDNVNSIGLVNFGTYLQMIFFLCCTSRLCSINRQCGLVALTQLARQRHANGPHPKARLIGWMQIIYMSEKWELNWEKVRTRILVCTVLSVTMGKIKQQDRRSKIRYFVSDRSCEL